VSHTLSASTMCMTWTGPRPFYMSVFEVEPLHESPGGPLSTSALSNSRCTSFTPTQGRLKLHCLTQALNLEVGSIEELQARVEENGGFPD